jgi:hypothetical protein
MQQLHQTVFLRCLQKDGIALMRAFSTPNALILHRSASQDWEVGPLFLPTPSSLRTKPIPNSTRRTGIFLVAVIQKATLIGKSLANTATNAQIRHYSDAYYQY